MNSRRDFLIGTVAPLVLVRSARAAKLCAPVKSMKDATVCRAYIDSTKASQETDLGNRDPRATWVACVAVVFALYNHVVSQARIIAEAYGGLDKVPVVSGMSVAAPLTRTWKDEEGIEFRASFEPLFDDSAGDAFNAKPLFEAIANGDPLILVEHDYPLVLTGLAYAQNAPERAVAGFVLDPRPFVGRRPLDLDELTPDSVGGELLLAVRAKVAKA